MASRWLPRLPRRRTPRMQQPGLHRARQGRAAPQGHLTQALRDRLRHARLQPSEDYNSRREEVADTNMSVPCFLVIHAKGILLLRYRALRSPGGPATLRERGWRLRQIKFNSLRGQLADIGITPAEHYLLAISHSHFDHVGNANDYAGLDWLAQKAERDFMFGTKADRAYVPLYAALAHARTVVFDGDHDVFRRRHRDSQVYPGHTPGHQALYVKLAKTGGVVISGDLYHYAEERTLHRMPNEEKSTAHSELARDDRAVPQGKNAQLWIGHSTSFFKNAIKVARLLRLRTSHGLHPVRAKRTSRCSQLAGTMSRASSA